jgi:hypothetical protein
MDPAKSELTPTRFGSSGDPPLEASESTSPSDAELEHAIVAAVMMGRGDVASTLALSLEERRRARASGPRDSMAADDGNP